jgi:rubrerythrin
MLSFYRASEISGSLFFGRLARSMRPGPLQRDMTKHFADESAHAWYWTECIEELGAQPVRIGEAYQDQYLEAAGMPVNVMEVLAITQVFEQRVISQYSVHATVPGLDPRIQATLKRIMEDEKWHIQWIKEALHSLEPKYGADTVASTLRRFKEADKAVYHQTMSEQEERVKDILKAREQYV